MTPKRTEEEEPIPASKRVIGNRRQAAAVALASALGPIVDVCLELGVTSPEMERILRGVFVEQAESLLVSGKAAGTAASDLRIGLMTGVHRNIVRKIRSTKPSARLQPLQQRHRADALLLAWSTDCQYLTTAGSPRDLPIEATDGTPSFSALVRLHMPGVRARTAIAELRRSGAIQLLPDEFVRLRSRTVRPVGITEASIAALGSQLSQLAQTLLHNLRNPGQQWFCETSESGFVDTGRLPFLRQTVARRAQNFLDVLAAELKSEGASPTTEQAVTLGTTVFCYEIPSPPTSATPKRRRSSKR